MRKKREIVRGQEADRDLRAHLDRDHEIEQKERKKENVKLMAINNYSALLYLILWE